MSIDTKDKKKLIRKLQKKFDYKHIHYTFTDGETQEEMFRSYNSGCQVENFIKELSCEYYIDNINSQKFTANYTFMVIKCIAYNNI